MTHKDLAVLVKGISPVIRDCVTNAVSGLTDRIAALEQRSATDRDLRERVAALERQAAAAERPTP